MLLLKKHCSHSEHISSLSLLLPCISYCPNWKFALGLSLPNSTQGSYCYMWTYPLSKRKVNSVRTEAFLPTCLNLPLLTSFAPLCSASQRPVGKGSVHKCWALQVQGVGSPRWRSEGDGRVRAGHWVPWLLPYEVLCSSQVYLRLLPLLSPLLVPSEPRGGDSCVGAGLGFLHSSSLSKPLQQIPFVNKLPLDYPNLNVPSVYSWDPKWYSPSWYPVL